MEFANQRIDNDQTISGVRTAQKSDAASLTELLREAAYSHLHVDWHYPADWLGSPGFVLLEEPRGSSAVQSLSSRFFNRPPRLQACLAVAADPAPVAWVRVTAVASSADPLTVLGVLLAEVKDSLQETAVTQIAWLPIDDWPQNLLPQLGFTPINEIETYYKKDMSLPTISAVPGLVLRPVRDEDYAALTEMERQTFAPLWRHSANGLRLARKQTVSFDVAELHGQLAGFQFSTRGQSGAHMARMIVAPTFQGSGVGSALLAHAIQGYQRQGLRAVTLNTQIANIKSQRLYQRFGFRGNGQRYPIWAIDL